MTDVATGPGWELRLGKWQDVLADVKECAALITDPPYSARTHDGERGLRTDRVERCDPQAQLPKNGIAYPPLASDEADRIALRWAPVTKWWAIVFGDDDSKLEHKAAWEGQGWYTFASVVYVKRDAPPRFSGDGPASSCEYMQVARPKHRLPPERSGSRPGHYVGLTEMARNTESTGFVGQKDIRVMRALIRDYTLPGDLVVDPYAGTGTTLLAAAMEGRRAIGAECDPKHFALAVKRLRAGYTGTLL